MDLSRCGADLLMSARRSTKGALILGTLVPAALRELQDNGLVNSHYKLTERGAREHAARTTGSKTPVGEP
jgi:hypothetical protein